MKYALTLFALLAAVPAMADDCLDGGVRFRSFADTGGAEIYLGQPDLGFNQNRVERNIHWNSGPTPKAKSFEFVYDSAGNSVVNVPSEEVLLGFITPPPIDINTLLIDVASRDDGSSVELIDLTVNNIIFGSFATEGLERWVFPVEPASEYNVTGIIRYSGPFSNSQELSRVEVRLGNDECGLLPPPLPEAVPVPFMSGWAVVILIGLFVAVFWIVKGDHVR